MTELPPTTPSELARAHHFIVVAKRDIMTAATDLTTAGRALACGDQETAVERLGKFAGRAEVAARAARNAAVLLF